MPKTSLGSSFGFEDGLELESLAEELDDFMDFSRDSPIESRKATSASVLAEFGLGRDDSATVPSWLSGWAVCIPNMRFSISAISSFLEFCMALMSSSVTGSAKMYIKGIIVFLVSKWKRKDCSGYFLAARSNTSSSRARLILNS